MKTVFGVILLAGAFMLGAGSGHAAEWGNVLQGIMKGGSKEPSTTSAVGSLTQQEMTDGLLEALSTGVRRATDLLGAEGGFLNDKLVRIPMPEPLAKVEGVVRKLGQDKLADNFIQTMNRAAEQAMPKATAIFTDAIKNMSVDDAKAILTGPDDAATQFFRKTTGPQLTAALKTVIQQATDEVGVTSAYKKMAKQASFLGQMVDTGSLDLDNYVTDKALDGLFLKLAEQEKLIRTDPLARGTDLLRKVFGSLDS